MMPPAAGRMITSAKTQLFWVKSHPSRPPPRGVGERGAGCAPGLGGEHHADGSGSLGSISTHTG